MIQEAQRSAAASDFSSCEGLCRQALAEDPKAADAWNLLGVVLCMRGEAREAVEALDQAVALRPEQVWFHVHHGNARREAGKLKLAVASYRAAVKLKPDLHSAHALLGDTLLKTVYADERNVVAALASEHTADFAIRRLGKMLEEDVSSEAIVALRRAVELAPAEPEYHRALAVALRSVGEDEAAIESCRKGLALAPHDARIEYLLGRLTGHGPDIAPAVEVARLFDQSAANYDELLVEHLKYRGPEVLDAALKRAAAPGERRWTVLDLGCGTGLCAPFLRPWSARLEGVDLSPRMVEIARENGLYDALEVGEMHAVLERAPDAYDLVVAGDVFVYVGNLERAFAASARALKPGGWLAFTTERGEGEGFGLQPTGRFRHGDAYLQRLAREHGFAIEVFEETVVRRQNDRDVVGHVCVMRKTSDAELPPRSSGVEAT